MGDEDKTFSQGEEKEAGTFNKHIIEEWRKGLTSVAIMVAGLEHIRTEAGPGKTH